MSSNPYAAPKAELAADGSSDFAGDAVAIRKAHLNHEASIRGLGALWMLGACLTVFAALYSFFAPNSQLGPVVITLLVAGGLFVCARDVRRLRPRARITGSIMAVLSLLGFPLGTLIGLYALYLLHSRKGQVVLGEDYVRIRELTPEVKYRTSIVVWIALALLVGLVLVGAISALMS